MPMTLEQFGQTIKAKHPEYGDMSDADVGTKVLAKYPQYQDMVQAGPQSQPEGFWHSLGSQFGLTPEAAQAAAQDAKDHPIKTAISAALGPGWTLVKGMAGQAQQSAGQIGQAVQSAKEGNAAGVAQHAITAIPVVGPALDKASDQYADKNYMGEAGTLTGAAAQAAPVVLGAADAAGVPRPNSSLPNLVSKFPTKGAAGEIFNNLNTKLAEQPVNLDTTAAPLQRAIEIAARGGTMPAPVKALLERSQAIEPMTFPEARDYQASLSDLSASDKLAMNGRMKGAVAQLNRALYQDIRQAAESGGGMGTDYDKAMTQYRQAAQIKNAVAATGKAVGKAAATGALGASGYSLLRQIQDSR